MLIASDRYINLKLILYLTQDIIITQFVENVR